MTAIVGILPGMATATCRSATCTFSRGRVKTKGGSGTISVKMPTLSQVWRRQVRNPVRTPPRPMDNTIPMSTRVTTALLAIVSSLWALGNLGAQLKQPALTTNSSTMAILAFRGGLKASPLAIPNPNSSPLTSIGLTWASYPNASGYRVLGALMNSSGGPMTLFSVLTGSDLSATTAAFTASGLPPGASVGFRIVALMAGTPKDTTTLVTTTTAAYPTSDNWSAIASRWPAPTSGGIGIVWARRCASLSFTYSDYNKTASSTWLTAWARNSSASSYTVQLIRVGAGTIQNGNLLPDIARTTTDTSIMFSVPPGKWAAFVRAEFVPVPLSGSTAVHGAWSYFGTLNSLPPMAIYPCTQT